MKFPEELLNVELIAATTKPGKQCFMHNPYAAHLKLIQQQKVQWKKSPTIATLMLTQLSKEYQVFFKIILSLLIGKHFQALSDPLQCD